MDIVVNGLKERAPLDSTLLPCQGDYFVHTLLRLGYDPEQLPLADLLRAYYQLTGQWLIASPIHWQATHNDGMIVATGEALELTASEAQLWFNAVAQFLSEDNFSPLFHNAYTWLFKQDKKPPIRSKSVHAILHQSLMPILNTLDPTLYWQRLITELQMFLSAHPLNQQRKSKLPINGLWFWGEGEFKLPDNRPIATDDVTLLALAPENAKQMRRLLPTTSLTKNHLLIINNPQQIEFCHLEEKIRKKKVHWYWNNLAYSSPNIHWWTKLWR